LDHVAVAFGLFVAQTKLKTLVIRNILNIYRTYAEMGVIFFGLQCFAESTICGFVSVVCTNRYTNRDSWNFHT